MINTLDEISAELDAIRTTCMAAQLMPDEVNAEILKGLARTAQRAADSALARVETLSERREGLVRVA
ncbi:hypothetical protein [Zobellella iuensis]|uniref:Uncharacterized protein n=1 Tax=Zobellella iuensis TaxID=2803811 RepID=A0ABS1QN32_9GAMM|nr:hypothetical protein [Zobellella iuensis]MBL1376270.1 hypothetical protein [Zobellella iuensis]